MAHMPDYQQVTRSLDMVDGSDAAAEAHGTLCGLLCTAAGDLPAAWIDNTLADATEGGQTIPAGARDVLLELYDETRAALRGPDMEFEPLLPGGEQGLGERTRALASWCQGFLYGLAMRGLRDFGELDGEIREFLEDLVQITRAEPGSSTESEDGEAAFYEIMEYVRVGVQFVFDVSNPAPPVKRGAIVH